MHNLNAGRPSLLGYPQLLIQHISSCLPYLEAIPSICDPRMYYLEVTIDAFDMVNLGLPKLNTNMLYIYGKS
jgi:hypothetical protein